MRITMRSFLIALFLALPFSTAMADEYEDTMKIFKNAGQSGSFFSNSHGYAVFPTIGKGGIGLGGAHGNGQVYQDGAVTGTTATTKSLQNA